MVIFLSITGASLLLSGLNLKTASNYKSGNSVLNTADAGIQHALAAIPVGMYFDYGSNATVLSATGFPSPNSGYTYTVTATNDPPTSSITSRAILTSTAAGPNGSRRVVRAYIERSTNSWLPPGAVHIPGSSSDEAFDPSGTNWTVTGNDTNCDNTAGPKAAIVGITSTSAAVVGSILDELNSEPEKQRVTGLGYIAGPPHTTPSIQQSSRTDDVNTIGQDFISQVTSTNCPPKCLSGLTYNSSSCPASSPCTLGTDANPQITYITGASRVTLGGYTSGSGVLVIQSKEVRFLDNFTFHGLVIHLQDAGARSDSEMKFTTKDNAKIYGSLLLGPNNTQLEFEMKNYSEVRYSSQALGAVNTNWGACCLPNPARVIAWVEMMQ